jgi:SAM-dependent methyltransferase
MDRGYWDGIADVYEKEIFSVLHNDHQGLIKEEINKAASPDATVADIGCGIGYFIPILADAFGHVYANDISGKLLKTAKSSYGDLPNVTFLRGDVGFVFKRIPKVDCILSVNSLISSSISVRQRMLQAMSAILRPGGKFILVVPSLESKLFVDLKHMHWKWKEGMALPAALRSTFAQNDNESGRVRQGIIHIDGVATKHYLREELFVRLSDFDLEVENIRKIKYGWETEFENPPEWMGEPYPWDWLVTAKKKI